MCSMNQKEGEKDVHWGLLFLDPHNPSSIRDEVFLRALKSEGSAFLLGRCFEDTGKYTTVQVWPRKGKAADLFPLGPPTGFS